MKIRYGALSDLSKLEMIERASYPAAEAASEESIEKRLKAFPKHFWVLESDDDILSFINGMVTDHPDLTDDMYEDASMHEENGAWQMIFSVVTAPEYRGRGYASKVMREVIEDCKRAGYKGIVLTCKDRLIGWYASFGYIDEGVSESTHGDALWHQMRMIF